MGDPQRRVPPHCLQPQRDRDPRGKERECEVDDRAHRGAGVPDADEKERLVAKHPKEPLHCNPGHVPALRGLLCLLVHESGGHLQERPREYVPPEGEHQGVRARAALAQHALREDPIEGVDHLRAQEAEVDVVSRGGGRGRGSLFFRRGRHPAQRSPGLNRASLLHGAGGR